MLRSAFALVPEVLQTIKRPSNSLCKPLPNTISFDTRRRPISISNQLYKKQKHKNNEAESDDEDEIELPPDALLDKNSKIMDVRVTNLRVDGIIKIGLGMARNKIELHFYENKIRVNGIKVMKKSEHVTEGDEIDVIKGPSPTNPNLLTVSRVEILSAVPKDEFIALKLRRCKNLLIEPYENRV